MKKVLKIDDYEEAKLAERARLVVDLDGAADCSRGEASGLIRMISSVLLTKSRNDLSDSRAMSILPFTLTAPNSFPMFQDEKLPYSDDLLLAYYGIDPV